MGRIIEIKGFDGSYAKVEIASSSNKGAWRMGVCWAIWCGNPFHFIHLNRNGKATHAYCYHLIRNFPPLRKNEKWVHVEKGKLITDKEG